MPAPIVTCVLSVTVTTVVHTQNCVESRNTSVGKRASYIYATNVVVTGTACMHKEQSHVLVCDRETCLWLPRYIGES